MAPACWPRIGTRLGTILFPTAYAWAIRRWRSPSASTSSGNSRLTSSASSKNIEAAMLLAHVAATSRQIAATSKRLAKIKLLADLLKQLAPAEIEIVVPFLSGFTRQGRIGVGYAAVRDAQTAAAPAPTLEVIEVDRQLDALA